MGRGIAVLFIGPDGEAADIIRKYNAGIVLTGSVEEDLKVLEDFFSRDNWREALSTMGKNGAQAVVEHYSRSHLAEKYLKILEEAI